LLGEPCVIARGKAPLTFPPRRVRRGGNPFPLEGEKEGRGEGVQNHMLSLLKDGFEE